jgi:predicted DNA-binding transcriptional regulator YafY
MAKRPNTMETVMLSLELLRHIERGPSRSTAPELQQKLKEIGIERNLRTIQRQLDALCDHFFPDIERNESVKPYQYRWVNEPTALAVSRLTPQESLLLQLAEEHLKNLLPAPLMRSMASFFDQAKRNLGATENKGRLEREWPGKVRVVATSQPLLPPKVDAKVFEIVSDALYRNNWLELDYQNAVGKRSNVDVMPLGLVQQGACLYLVCRYRDYDNERNLALHRILSAEQKTFTFERPEAFCLKKYDEDGRFGFGEGKKISLSFCIDRQAGAHLLESPMSTDQQVVDLGDEKLRITATVIDSAMLERWLRGFGDAIKDVRRQPCVAAI